MTQTSISSPINGVFDETECGRMLTADFANARGRIIVVSPYATVSAVQRWESKIEAAIKRDVRVCVLLQQPRNWTERLGSHLSPKEASDLRKFEAAVQLLEAYRVHVAMRPGLHEKLVLIDEHILWEGSLNFLSWYNTTERTRRWFGYTEVRNAMNKHKLQPCPQCPPKPTLWSVLRDRRKFLGIHQDELARRTSVSRRTIQRIEKGLGQINVGTLEKLCTALDLTVNVLPSYAEQSVMRLTRFEAPE